MTKKITPEEARAYLADSSNFYPDDELCYICGIEYDWSSVECDGHVFCTSRCCNQYVRIAKRAATDAAITKGEPK